MTKKIIDFDRLPSVYAGDRLEILFNCIDWATFFLGEYLDGILDNISEGVIGGDPGWSIELLEKRDDALEPEQWSECIKNYPSSHFGCYEAYVSSDLSGLDNDVGYYSVEEVRYYFRMALDNIVKMEPDRSKEIAAIIQRYKL